MSEMSQNREAFERLLQEYQICREEVLRLDDNIWKTATILGIGSVIAFIKIISIRIDPLDHFIITLLSGILIIVVYLVWWRFARRWWSIQELKLLRMTEIDDEIGFRQSKLVKEHDDMAMMFKRYLQINSGDLQKMWYNRYILPDRIKYPEKYNNNEMINDLERKIRGHILFLKNRGTWFQRKWFSCCRINNDYVFDKNYLGNHEYRGIQPVCRLLILINILLWLFYTCYRINKICTWSLNLKIGIIFVSIIIVSFAIFYQWRKP